MVDDDLAALNQRANEIAAANARRQMAQLRHAEAMMKREHERLLAEGYKWDGQDGYWKEEETNAGNSAASDTTG